MSDPHDWQPIDSATIDCWRINYGLDTRSPRDAAQWWHDNFEGRAPVGAVAALGVALGEIEHLRSHIAEQVAAERERCAKLCEGLVANWTPRHLLSTDIPWEAETAGAIDMAKECADAIRSLPQRTA